MNIKLIAIGKTDNKNLQMLIDEYQKRLSFYIKFDLEIIPDIKSVKNLSESQQRDKEGELILAKVAPTDHLILLDENGKTFSSVSFAEELQTKMNAGIKTLVFSSSATVYGDPQRLPLTEVHPLSATSPYGQTKLDIENMLRALHLSDPSWRICVLRYFNPVGAHESGLIGEDPRGIPNNLLPYVAQVAIGRREFLNIWGNDYPTPDGTGVRDYIHVVDLAQGHLKALQRLERHAECTAINLGTGTGYSVLDMVWAFEKASEKSVPFKIAERRAGDVASCYADPGQALVMLGWRAQRDLETMCEDAWRWQNNNPHGYESA